MEQQIRDTAEAVQRIIKKALNNIRTGLIKRIMSLFKIFSAIGKKLNPLDFFLGPAAQKAFKKIIKNHIDETGPESSSGAEKK